MTTATRYRVLEPTAESVQAHGVMADRPGGLEGLTVGLLANGKRNADVLLNDVGRLLMERHGVKQVVARNKGDASRPAPQAIVDELLGTCDVVVTATGD